MVITHHGGQCIKATFGDLTVAFDPISKGSKLPAARFGADLVLISRNHPDFNGAEQMSGGSKDPFVVTGPGEYEKEGVTVRGFLTQSEYGLEKTQESAINTLYLVKLEGMTLLFAGALNSTQLPPEAKEAIEDIDVLFVPIGGDGVLSPADAAKLATMLEARIVVPIHWHGMGEEDALEAFIKETDGEAERVDKLTIKKKDAAAKEGAVVVITP